MRKLNAVLHDVTFLNFPFLWTQVKRYSSVSLLFPILLVLFLFAFEKTQFTIYSLNIESKISSKAGTGLSSTPGQAIMFDNQTTLSYEELAAFVGSYEFQHYLAEEIVKSKIFYKLNFSPLNSTSFKAWFKAIQSCKQNKICESDKLTNTIGRFYDVKKGQSEGRFIFSVSSLDQTTTQELAHILTAAVVTSRLKSIQAIYLQQAQHATEMIEKSREEMIKHGGTEALSQFRNNELKIAELKEKSASLLNSLNLDSSTLSTIEFKLKEGSNSRKINSQSETSEQIDTEKFKKQILKIDELRQNIAALSSLPSTERTQSDEAVLSQMQSETRRLEKEVNFSSKNSQQISDEDNFLALQNNNKNYLNFDYQILKKKTSKEQAELKETSILIEKYTQANLELESSSSILKQDLEYIKLLESKMISIKLMMTTLTSDLLFEKYNTQLDEFNRSSGIKNFIFAFLMAFSTCFLLLLIRYFLDDRLYEEHEIKKCFQDLVIIGKTPDFN